MKTTEALLSIIGIVIGLIMVIYCVKVLIRNNRVYKFRRNIIDNHYEIYDQLPTYEEMIHDGKPLKIESYIDISDLDK